MSEKLLEGGGETRGDKLPKFTANNTPSTPTSKQASTHCRVPLCERQNAKTVKKENELRINTFLKPAVHGGLKRRREQNWR